MIAQNANEIARCEHVKMKLGIDEREFAHNINLQERITEYIIPLYP